MSDKLNIEELFQTRLEGAELSPSPASWKAIQRKLRWKQFLRFNPTRFNIYYAGALLLAASALALVLAGNRQEADQAVSEELSIPLNPEETTEARTLESGPESASEQERDMLQKETAGDQNGTATDSGEVRGIQNSQAGQENANADSSQKSLEEMLLLSPEIDNQEAPAPIAYFTSSIQTGCVPLTVQFTDQSLNATSYVWDFGTGDMSTEQHPVYEFKEAGRYMVTLTTENHGSQPTTSRMLVEVMASPVADFQIEEGLEGIDNHVVLNLVNYSSGGSAFTWKLVNENCVDCSDWTSNAYQPELGLKSISPESRSVRLEVINEQGCSDTAVQTLPLIVQSSEDRIKFPTAFSPNPGGPGDGSFTPGSKRIDLFHPVYLEVPVEFHMRVYTRRGELIFETRELYQGWDGYLLHERAKSDVYVWMAEGKWEDGQSFSLHGDVTIVWNKYW